MKSPIIYFKANNDQFGIFTKGGKVSKMGKGIGGLINPTMTSVSLIQLGLRDTPFNLSDRTQDKQLLSLAGSLQYRVEDPEKLASNFSYVVNPRTRVMEGDGPTKLNDYLIGNLATGVRKIVQGGELEKLLVSGEEIQSKLKGHLEGEIFANLGLRFDDVQLLEISGDRKAMDALGANYMERLLTQQQAAQYKRRADGVESEKAIKQNELENAMAIATKKAELIKLERANALAEAQYQSEAAKLAIDAFEGVDAEKLTAYALLNMGERASDLTHLTIGSELLRGA